MMTQPIRSPDVPKCVLGFGNIPTDLADSISDGCLVFGRMSAWSQDPLMLSFFCNILTEELNQKDDLPKALQAIGSAKKYYSIFNNGIRWAEKREEELFNEIGKGRKELTDTSMISSEHSSLLQLLKLARKLPDVKSLPKFFNESDATQIYGNWQKSEEDKIAVSLEAIFIVPRRSDQESIQQMLDEKILEDLKIDTVDPQEENSNEPIDDIDIEEKSAVSTQGPIAPSNAYFVSEDQKRVAGEIVRKALNILKDSPHKFSDFRFIIVSPRFKSLRTQTAQRVLQAGLATKIEEAVTKVAGHSKNDRSWSEFRKQLQASDDSTLFVIVDDECHWAPVRNGAHDSFINDPEVINKKNVLILQVSATPQNCLSMESRVLEDNVIYWDTQKNQNLYRSLDFYLETMLWSVDPKWSLTLQNSVNGQVVHVGIGEKMKDIWFSPFDYEDFCQCFNELLAPDFLPAAKNALKVTLKAMKKTGENPIGFEVWVPKEWKIVIHTANDLLFIEALGFEKSKVDGCQAAGRDSYIKYLSSREAQLCDPKTNRTSRPLSSQYVRSDESVLTMVTKSKQQDVKKKKNGKALEWHASHVLVADYIVSMAYHAFFRLCNEIDSVNLGSVLNTKIAIPSSDDFERRIVKMVEKLDDITTWKIEDQQGFYLETFGDTMKLVLKDFEEEALETLRTKADGDEGQEDAWRKRIELWKLIISAKVRDENNLAVSNLRTSWFTESDRLIRTLLSGSAPTPSRARKGYMVFCRVYGKDRCQLLQATLRRAMKHLGLHYKDKNETPFFGVVSDNGDVRLRQEVSHQKWLDARLDSAGSSVASRTKSTRVVTYEDLANVPCLILLCEKGRMGDTFPHSLQIIDVRSRAAGTYSCMIQEFGRACRYPRLDPLWRETVDESKSPTCFDRVKARFVQLRADNIPMALFRGKFDIPELSRKGTFLGQAETDDELDELWKIATRNDVFVQYEYPLPSLLVSREIESELMDATKFRNRLVRNNVRVRGDRIPSISECISLQVDQYLPSSSTKSNTKKATFLTPIHTVAQYRSYEVADEHFDRNVNLNHPRRLLLFAQTQIGKTGVFLEVIAQLKSSLDRIQPRSKWSIPPVRELIPEPENPDLFVRDDWLLPHWTLLMPPLYTSLSSKYSFPKDGQYHKKILSQREKFVDSIGAGENFALKAAAKEVILSKVGCDKLEYARDGTRKQKIDWDGKLSAIMDEETEHEKSDLDTMLKWNRPIPPSTGSKNGRHQYSAKVMSQPEQSKVMGKHLRRVNLDISNLVNTEFDIWIPDCLSGSADRSEANSKYLPWVFVPTHNRAAVASLDYSGTMDERRPVVIVCRMEQFEPYRLAYGHKYRIIGMPTSFHFSYPKHQLDMGALELHSAQHGIGFARLFIMLCARYYFNLAEIWMLDDNIVSCYDRIAEGGITRCRFEDVMQSLECIMASPDQMVVGGGSIDISDLSKVGCMSLNDHLRSHQKSAVLSSFVARTIVEYCGSRKNYGVIGITRLDRFNRQADQLRPFDISSHSIYSFMLLNLEQLCSEGLYFPAKPWMEDIEFMHCVDEAGLAVVKCNRFIHVKNYPRPQILDESDVKSNPLVAYLLKEVLPEFDILPCLETPWREALAHKATWRKSLENELDDTRVLGRSEVERKIALLALVEPPVDGGLWDWKRMTCSFIERTANNNEIKHLVLVLYKDFGQSGLDDVVQVLCRTGRWESVNSTQVIGDFFVRQIGQIAEPNGSKPGSVFDSSPLFETPKRGDMMKVGLSSTSTKQDRVSQTMIRLEEVEEEEAEFNSPSKKIKLLVSSQKEKSNGGSGAKPKTPRVSESPKDKLEAPVKYFPTKRWPRKLSDAQVKGEKYSIEGFWKEFVQRSDDAQSHWEGFVKTERKPKNTEICDKVKEWWSKLSEDRKKDLSPKIEEYWKRKQMKDNK